MKRLNKMRSPWLTNSLTNGGNKEDYRCILDQQNKFISNLKYSKRKLKEESNIAERRWLNNQYNQENDLVIGKRMKSIDRLKKINNENKLLNQIRVKQNSLEGRKQEGDTYKENPIEYRLRTDFLNNKFKNKIQERDIVVYNQQLAKQKRMKQEHHREKDKYYSKQFDEFVEKQAATYLLNRTSQQNKYETKRQIKDLYAFKERTMKVKRQLDDIISKHKIKAPENTSGMEELLQMDSVIRKCLTDIEKAEKVHPKNPNSMTREVSYKNNIILDWQIHDKKIHEIETKLNDKEYKNYLEWQADNEISILNEELKIKRERQSKYHEELQKQEKHQRMLKRNLDLKMNERERIINKRSGDHNYSVNDTLSFKSSDRFSSKGDINKTIDPIEKKIPSYQKQNNSMLRYGISGRKHKNDIPIASKNIDHMGNILDRSATSGLKKLQQSNLGVNSRMPGIQNININNNNSAEMVYPKLTNRKASNTQLTDRDKDKMPRIHSSLEQPSIPKNEKASLANDYSPARIPRLNDNHASTNGLYSKLGNGSMYNNYNCGIRKSSQRNHLALDKPSSNSLSGRHISLNGNNDYSNILKSYKDKLVPTPLQAKLKKNRDFFNPITGGIL